jgi:hypothetical protein
VSHLSVEAETKFGPSGEAYEQHCAFLADELGIDADAYIDAPSEACCNAVDAFVATAPTTIPGLIAMLDYAAELMEEGHDNDILPLGDVITTLAPVAKALLGRSA